MTTRDLTLRTRPGCLLGSSVRLFPDADGDSIAITEQYPLSGDHYDKVDDAANYYDPIFVYETGTDYTRDLYALPASGGSGAVAGIVVFAWCQAVIVPVSTYTLRASFKLGIKTGGIDFNGAEQTGIENKSTLHKLVYLLNPDTGIAWTWTDIDALQLAISLRKPTTDVGPIVNESYCMQIWVEVIKPVALTIPSR